MFTTSRALQAMGQFTSEMNRNFWSFLKVSPRQVPPSVQLKGETFIVTGGNRGFGKGVTLELVARGANVIIAAGGSEAKGNAIQEASKLHPDAPPVTYYNLDLASFESIRDFSRQVHERFGGKKKLSGLVNSAGLWTGEQVWTEARPDQVEMELSWSLV